MKNNRLEIIISTKRKLRQQLYRIVAKDFIKPPGILSFILAAAFGVIVAFVPIILVDQLEVLRHWLGRETLSYPPSRIWGMGSPESFPSPRPSYLFIYKTPFIDHSELSSATVYGEKAKAMMNRPHGWLCSEIVETIKNDIDDDSWQEVPAWALRKLPQRRLLVLERQIRGWPYRCAYADSISVTDGTGRVESGWLVGPRVNEQGIDIPGQFIWHLLALNILIPSCLLLVVLRIWRCVRAGIRIWRTKCPQCGYVLMGRGFEAGCSECGWNRPKDGGNTAQNDIVKQAEGLVN